MGDYLSKAQILSIDDFEYADVDVPEWHGKVRVRNLSGEEGDELQSLATDEQNVTNIRFAVQICCLGCVDEKGSRLFVEGEKDVEALARKSMAALFRVAERIAALSGISKEGRAEVGKGSEKTPAGASTGEPA